MSKSVHWVFSKLSVRTFCGILAYLLTTHKEKVTCQRCIRLMKLHNHLPEEEPNE